MQKLKFSESMYLNRPKLEREIRERLTTTLEPDAVGRVMVRVQRAYADLQFPNALRGMPEEHAVQIMRYETFSRDFRLAQAAMFQALVNSFVALENGRGV